MADGSVRIKVGVDTGDSKSKIDGVKSSLNSIKGAASGMKLGDGFNAGSTAAKGMQGSVSAVTASLGAAAKAAGANMSDGLNGGAAAAEGFAGAVSGAEDALGATASVAGGDFSGGLNGGAAAAEGFAGSVSAAGDALGAASSVAGSDFSSGLNSGTSAASGLVGSLSSVVSGFAESGVGASALGNIFATTVTDGIGMAVSKLKEFATASVSVGMDFEVSMDKVAALSGASGDELAALTDKAKEMGSSTQYTATQAADALGYMALAGWDSQQSIDGLDGVLQLAQASQMDLAEASDMVTDYLSAFGLAASDSAHFADAMAYAQANSNTTTQQLGMAFRNCSANAHAAGLSVETTTAAIAMMSNQGLKGSEAGTALNAVMRDMTSRMEDGAIAIGKTKVQVQDAQGNYRDFVDIISDVDKATQGMGDAEKAAALQSTFTADSIRGLNLLVTAGADSMGDFRTQLEGCDGSAKDMADTMTGNLNGAIVSTQSAIEGIQIDAFEKIAPVLSTVVVAFKDNVLPAVKEFVDWAGEAGGVVGSTLSPAFDVLSSALSTAWSAFNLVAEVVGGVFLNALELVSAVLSPVVDVLSGLLSPALDTVSGAFDTARGAVEDISGKLDEFKKTVGDAVDSFIEQSGLLEAAGELWNGVTTTVGGAFDTIKAKAQEGMQTAQDAFIGAINGMTDESLQFTSVSDLISKSFEMINEVWDEVGPEVSAGFAELQDAFNELGSAFAEIGSAIGDAITELASIFTDATDEMTDATDDAASSTSDNGDEMKISWDSVKETIVAATRAIVSVVKTVSSVVKTVAGAVKSVASAVKGAVETMKTKIEEIKSFMGGLDFSSVGTNIVQGIWNGISGAAGWLYNQVASFANGVLNSMKAALGIHSPSKRFRDEVGVQITAGMAKGIEKGTDKVVKQAKKTADLTVSAFSKQLGKLEKQYGKSDKLAVAYWKKAGDKAKAGSAVQAKCYAKMQAAAEKYAETLTLGQQKDFYSSYNKGLKETVSNQNKAYKAAEKHVNALKKQADAQKSGTSEQKKAKAAYESANASLKKQATRLKESQKQLEESKKALKSVKEQIAETAQKAEESFLGVEKASTSSLAEIKANLEETIADLNESYQSAVESTKNSITSSLGFFKEFESEATGDKNTLIANLRSQTEAAKEYSETLASLKGRVGDAADGFFEYLTDAGIDSLADLETINSMTDEELQTTIELFKERQQYAQQAAATANEDLYKQTLADIETARQDAISEAQKSYDEYAKTMAELGKKVSKSVKKQYETDKASMDALAATGTEKLTELASAYAEAFGGDILDATKGYEQYTTSAMEAAAKAAEDAQKNISDSVDETGETVKTGTTLITKTVQTAMDTQYAAVSGTMSSMESSVVSTVSRIQSMMAEINSIQAAANARESSVSSQLASARASAARQSSKASAQSAAQGSPVALSMPTAPQVNWYAAGGIFNSPQVIGIGEQGTEFALRDYHLDAIAERMGSTQQADFDRAISRLVNALPGIIKKSTPDSISVNKREFGRLVREV